MSIPIFYALRNDAAFNYHLRSDTTPICGDDLCSRDWQAGAVVTIVDDVLCPSCATLRAAHPAFANLPSYKLMRQIYVIHMAALNFYKIGVTSDVVRRLRELQRTSPTPLRIVWHSDLIESDLAYAIEHKIHVAYRHVRVDVPHQREWFHIGHPDIKHIQSIVRSAVC